MDLTTELLVPSHQADLRRAARARRLGATVDRCLRLRFGFVPVREPCDELGRR
jgi:hypothetical protein